MRFIVRRTSLCGDAKPCDEAKLMTVEYWDIRTCSEEYFNQHLAKAEGLWKSKGTNHGVNARGLITRLRGLEETWGLEFTTLQDLTDFVNKYGHVVISFEESNNCYRIEIYDDYRE